MATSPVMPVYCGAPGCKQLLVGVSFLNWFVAVEIPGTTERPWVAFYAKPYTGGLLGPNETAACGHACAQKLFQQYMNKRVEAHNAGRSKEARGASS